MTAESQTIAKLWAAILIGPLVAAAQQQIGFMLVPWACATGLQPYIWTVTIVSMLIALGAAAMGWNLRGKVESEWMRFMATGAAALGLMFALLILAQGIPTYILNPCQ